MKPHAKNENSDIGQRIRSRRKLLGFTPQQFASLIGVSHQQLNKYENGENRIPAPRLAKMSRILNVSLDYLVQDEPKILSPIFPQPSLNSAFRAAEIINQPETNNLIKSYVAIGDPRVRMALVELVTSITKYMAKRVS